MPCVAALLGVNQVSDLMTVEGSHTFKRPIYAGNAIITVEVLPTRSWSPPCVPRRGRKPPRAVAPSSKRPASMLPCRPTPASSASPRVPATALTCRAPSAWSPAVRGVGSEENFKVIFQLADKLGAAVGASRAAVDAGYVPSDLQVGQTGKIIAPELYVAVGISGAIQHLTGIRMQARSWRSTRIRIRRSLRLPILVWWGSVCDPAGAGSCAGLIRSDRAPDRQVRARSPGRFRARRPSGDHLHLRAHLYGCRQCTRLPNGSWDRSSRGCPGSNRRRSTHRH